MILKERFTMSLKFALFVVVALPLIALPISGFAAGDSGDSDSTNNADSIKKKKFVFKCFRGWIRNPKGRCVREEKSSGLDQDTIYYYGRDLAREGQYDNAIRVLYLAHDQSDPRVLNYLGYSNRKLGNMEKALGYYRAAVASNPDYSLVREYLGEAYVQLGELEKAREQLTQIERICSNKTCHEYSMLSKYLVESQL
jgi:tetratricopeptide (TPR) repeat protein